VRTLGDRELADALVHHARAARRLRLEIPDLYGDHRLAREIERTTSRRDGIARVVANPRSGRVLIELEAWSPLVAEIAALGAEAGRRGHVARRTPPGVGEAVAAAHAKIADEVVTKLRSHVEHGITQSEARRRLSRYGENTLDRARPPSRLALAARQLANVPSALLLGGAAVSLLFGDVLDAGAIVIVIGLNAYIGYRMERTNQRLLDAWRHAEAGTADVIRGGRPTQVNVAELVPGDLLMLRVGNVIPADARIVDAHRLQLDESVLTGESEAVAKTEQAVSLDATLAARTCMLYRGTTVVGGHGRAVITAIGDATEIGNVRRLAAAARPRARLAARLDKLGVRLAAGGLVAAGVSAIASIVWRKPPIEVIRDTVALGVAAIPEGLPVTSSVALVRAMARMRDRGAIVRRLATAETLGSVTVVCADKTGTLTENRMRLEAIWIEGTRIPAAELRSPGLSPVRALLAAAVLNSDLDFHHNADRLHIAGSPTERAIAQAALSAGLDPVALRVAFPRSRLIERDDQARYVISEHTGPDGSELAFVKGAPEQILELCGVSNGALDENARMAAEGLRVLGVASRNGGGTWRLLGLVALRDALREGAAAAIRGAVHAGIRSVILTGDQRATASAIARAVGLEGEIVEGSDVPAVIGDLERLRNVAVFARVTPADKLAVIEALRAAGEVVAMAGDGINDAPALRAADVGIAVGVHSSDLARQTADVVLEHEDLRSILIAIGEGRIVQDNLRRSVRFQVAGNLGEVLLVMGGAFLGRRPISALGLLWINLLTDTFPGLALALEPGHPEVLARPPPPANAAILERRDWARAARDGVTIAAVSSLAALAGGPIAAFAAIGALQFGYAAMCRSSETRLDRMHHGRRFARMVGGSAALHAAAIALAPVRGLLQLRGSVPAGLGSFAFAIGIPLYLASRAHRLEITRDGTHTKDSP
jgi:Ca2+-transporting ATPase